jgi:hypothetical protein
MKIMSGVIFFVVHVQREEMVFTGSGGSWGKGV